MAAFLRTRNAQNKKVIVGCRPRSDRWTLAHGIVFVCLSVILSVALNREREGYDEDFFFIISLFSEELTNADAKHHIYMYIVGWYFPAAEFACLLAKR